MLVTLKIEFYAHFACANLHQVYSNMSVYMYMREHDMASSSEERGQNSFRLIHQPCIECSGWFVHCGQTGHTPERAVYKNTSGFAKISRLSADP